MTRDRLSSGMRSGNRTGGFWLQINLLQIQDSYIAQLHAFLPSKQTGMISTPPSSPSPLSKVTDFGLAHMRSLPGCDSHMVSRCGTLSYMAPEVLNTKHEYTKMCDVWSLGVIMYTLWVPYKTHWPSTHSYQRGMNLVIDALNITTQTIYGFCTWLLIPLPPSSTLKYSHILHGSLLQGITRKLWHGFILAFAMYVVASFPGLQSQLMLWKVW